MQYKVNLTRRAEKDLSRIDGFYRAKALKALDKLTSDPFLGDKLKGELAGLYRVKIPPIRIIYEPDIKAHTIMVKTIGHRQGIYKK